MERYTNMLPEKELLNLFDVNYACFSTLCSNVIMTY
jgi:hypothetical protein